MKKFLTVALVFLPFAVFAQEMPAPDMADSVIQFVLGMANSIPFVGQYLPMVLKVMGILAVSLTSVSAVLIALSSAFNLVGLSKASEFIQKYLPYLQKISMFNVQKKV